MVITKRFETFLELKMNKLSFNVLINLVLAFIIFYNAELGRLLGLHQQPLSISVVWPTTGFALAAVMLFGYRVWAGIFLGNFFYNLIHFFLQDEGNLYSFITPAVIAGGSVIQALVGGYIIRRFSTINYFNTVKDVVIFLFFGGLITCLIASVIGTISLYLYGVLPLKSIFLTGLSFWVGDTMGVFVFTPLLIVWTIHQSNIKWKEYSWEIILMTLSFGLLFLLSFVLSIQIAYSFIPLFIWISYRFRMRGATTAIFLLALFTITATAMNYGIFALSAKTYPLLVLVVYLETIVAISLLVAAVVNEREEAWDLLKSHNTDLKDAVISHQEELKEKSEDILIKNKLASVGLLTSGIAQHIQIPIKHIGIAAFNGLQNIGNLKSLLNEQTDEIQKKFELTLRKQIENLENCLNDITKYEGQANRVAKIIKEQSILASPDRIKVKLININMLLNLCISQVKTNFQKIYPDFNFNIIENFDPSSKIKIALPENLAHAIIHILNNSLYSMKEKHDHIDFSYKPILEINTKDFSDRIEILIRDNGQADSEENLKSSLKPISSTLPIQEAIGMNKGTTNIGLTFAYGIIVKLFQGEIRAKSVLGEYTEIYVMIPKANTESETS